MLSKLFFWRANSNSCVNLDRDDETRAIFVDVSVLAVNDAGTGIQRVVRAVYSHMQSMVPTGWLVIPVFATKQSPYAALPNDFAEYPVQQSFNARQFIKPRKGDVFFGLDLAAHILPHHTRQIACWRQAGVRCCFVVYDLLPHTNPDWFRPIAVKNFRKWLNFVVNNGDVIISISRHVRSQFLSYIKYKGIEFNWIGRTDVVKLGWDIENSMPSTGICSNINDLIDRISKSGRYVLMVGTIEPRKAYDVALKAFEKIWADPGSDYRLIIVGKSGWKSAALQRHLIQHGEARRRLWWLQDVSDEDLSRLYASASGLLFTSLAEGYGLPIGEALAWNKPVLARDIPVLRELFGDSIQYFNSDKPDDFASRIVDWMANDAHSSRSEAIAFSTWEQSTRDFFTALGVSETISQK